MAAGERREGLQSGQEGNHAVWPLRSFYRGQRSNSQHSIQSLNTSDTNIDIVMDYPLDRKLRSTKKNCVSVGPVTENHQCLAGYIKHHSSLRQASVEWGDVTCHGSMAQFNWIRVTRTDGRWCSMDHHMKQEVPLGEHLRGSLLITSCSVVLSWGWVCHYSWFILLRRNPSVMMTMHENSIFCKGQRLRVVFLVWKVKKRKRPNQQNCD